MSELIGEYRVAEAFSGGDLAREVNDLIQDGWQPFGPMIATPTPADGVELLQPMVRTQLRKPRRLTFLLSALHNR